MWSNMSSNQKQVPLYHDERLDYLLAENLRIIRSPPYFRSLSTPYCWRVFYIPIQKGKIIDLGTGNGVIPLFQRTKGKIVGVEIQERLYDMAKRSVEYNGLTDQIEIIHGDLREAPQKLGHNRFDVVTCNPPYFPSMKRPFLMNANPLRSPVMSYTVLSKMSLKPQVNWSNRWKSGFSASTGSFVGNINLDAKISARTETVAIRFIRN